MAKESPQRIPARLKKRDFDHICRSKAFRSTPTFRLFWSPNPGRRKRLGISVPRRVGTAVVRNRVRRRVREIHRQNAFLLPPGVDVVLVARGGIASLPYEELRAALLESFEAVKVAFAPGRG